MNRVFRYFGLSLVLVLHLATADAGPFEKGILWEISRAGQSSYLFGTYHTDNPKITKLPLAVEKAFSVADSVATEILLDPKSIMQVTMYMMYTDGQTLSQVIGEDLYAKILPLWKQKGMPELTMSMLKPWAVYTMLALPQQQNGKFLDQILFDRASSSDKKVYGLETADEQMQIFETMSVAEQKALLIELLQEYSQLDAKYAELTKLYLARDLKGMQELSDKNLPKDKQLAKRFTEDLLDKRNHRMVERMLPRLKEGKAFIAVGSLHLPGDEGILNLLSKRGFKVKVVY